MPAVSFTASPCVFLLASALQPCVFGNSERFCLAMSSIGAQLISGEQDLYEPGGHRYGGRRAVLTPTGRRGRGLGLQPCEGWLWSWVNQIATTSVSPVLRSR
jgi:hypothetical protein